MGSCESIVMFYRTDGAVSCELAWLLKDLPRFLVSTALYGSKSHYVTTCNVDVIFPCEPDAWCFLWTSLGSHIFWESTHSSSLQICCLHTLQVKIYCQFHLFSKLKTHIFCNVSFQGDLSPALHILYSFWGVVTSVLCIRVSHAKKITAEMS